MSSALIHDIEVFKDMPEKEYHASDRVSASFLKSIHTDGAAVANEKKMHGWPESSAMRLGSLVHTAVLEPELWGQMVVVAPCKKDTAKAFTSLREQNPGCMVVTEEEWEKAQRIAARVLAFEDAVKVLKGDREVSVFFNLFHDGTKVAMKCRFDVLGPGYVTDLKTSRDASPGGFVRQVGNLAYHIQMALYHDVAKAMQDADEMRFVIVAAHTSGSHMVGCYDFGEDDLDTGRMHYRDAVTQYLTCKRVGWPEHYTKGVMRLRLPGWV